MKYLKCMPIFVLLFVTACATTAKDDVALDLDRPSFSASQSVTVSALVTAIDYETRIVTVRKADGEEITFTASEDVRNLRQLEAGDVLLAEYVETVSIDVMANDGLGTDAAGAIAIARAEEGEKPGMAAIDTSVIIATVEDINLDRNTFKLKGPDGSVEEYVARNPDNLKRALVGDVVVITVTESVAIEVQEQPAN